MGVSPYSRILISRDTKRPKSHEFIYSLFDDFVELCGDRRYRDDEAIMAGVCFFEDTAITVIANRKGRSLDENLKYNFGMAHPEGYRKAIRLIKQAEKFRRPIITFVDTPGAFPGVESEERGIYNAISECLLAMSAATVPILSIITGEGGSGGALALSMGNEIHMFENASLSVISPEGFASILWKDSSRSEEAASVLKSNSLDLIENGMIEKVYSEPVNGLKEINASIQSNLKSEIRRFLDRFSSMTAEQIVQHRYDKYLSIGKYDE
jgi:acetyl-CoA carboxylase carboxyl transferase subunit alpha